MAQSVFAFGTEGHEVVALVADRQLTPDVRAQVALILSNESGATLSSISNWADQTRDRSTAAWHYVNMPRGSDCVYVAPRDCPGGNCVVGALVAQVARLRAGTGEDRLQALKYMVHFIGDIHQPLHAGFADDKGGNTFQLQAFGKGTNLHAVWDTGMVRDVDPRSSSLAATLLSSAAPSSTLSFAPDQWAKESCLIVNRPDFYPEGHKLSDAYVQRFEPVVIGRLYVAGLRLGAILNDALGTASGGAR